MKRKIYLIIIILSISTIGISQNNYIPETYVGIKLGANISTVRFDPTINQNINYGFIGGISFKHIEEKSLGIQLELNYMQAGWNENLDSDKEYKRRLNYIHFPIMSHFNFGNKTRFFINFGPYVSYLLSENEITQNIPESDTNSYYNIKIDNKFEFGMCLGLGVSHATSIGLFQVEGRGNLGLSNLYKSSSNSTLLSSKNTTVELSITYYIDYKKIRIKFKRRSQ